MLVDTSVWADHLRRCNPRLSTALRAEQVWVHPFVVGELACGNLAPRTEILQLLATLPQAPLAGHGDVLQFVEARRLYGRGMGWIDMHLLVSAYRAQLPFWTLDKRLAAVAHELALTPLYRGARDDSVP